MLICQKAINTGKILHCCYGEEKAPHLFISALIWGPHTWWQDHSFSRSSLTKSGFFFLLLKCTLDLEHETTTAGCRVSFIVLFIPIKWFIYPSCHDLHKGAMNWFLFQDYVRDFLRYWRSQNFTSLDAYFLLYKDKAVTLIPLIYAI